MAICPQNSAWNNAKIFLAVLVASLFLLEAKSVRADAGFDAWVKAFWPQARAAGVSKSTYDRAFQGLSPDPDVLRLAGRQAEFIKPIWDYLGSAVSTKRIEDGREKAVAWKSWLKRIEARYGVDQYIVLAIWGIESSYGAVLDNPKIVRNVIRSLATLAYRDKRRKKFGGTQLIAALKILERGDPPHSTLTGSWAGAMGHTQFIPTTYNAYAADIDGDGRRNIWTSIPDALASTANYLSESGWQKGKTWGYEVALPSQFNFALADEKTKKTLAEWSRLGVRRNHGRAFPRPNDEAVLILPAGARGPGFLMLKNFRVIKRYNNATAYALAVGHLADRIRGGEGFKQSWPTDTPPLKSKDEIRTMQTLLTRRGFGTGGVDGRIGPMTRKAIQNFQQKTGMIADGYPTQDLLRRLRGG